MSALAPLTPLGTLFHDTPGEPLPLPPALAALYGPLSLPKPADRPHVFANFVSTLDGVVALDDPNHAGGGDISGFNQHDRAVMGILRAVAGAVVAGAGTLRSVPKHLWTADYIYPPLAADYQALRTALGLHQPPLNVIVTARGDLDLTLPVFASGRVQTLIVTTAAGATRLAQHTLPPHVHISPQPGDSATAASILRAIQDAQPTGRILVEGGPHIMGNFFAEHLLDELFLTLAPQVAGRDTQHNRPGLAEGRIFAPAAPLWGSLTSVKRAESHLFLRYHFPATH